MPTHVALGANLLRGTLRLDNTKTGRVDYYDPAGHAVAFPLAPAIQITFVDSIHKPFKLEHVRTGLTYTGFRIGFAQAFTGTIEWTATQRT